MLWATETPRQVGDPGIIISVACFPVCIEVKLPRSRRILMPSMVLELGNTHTHTHTQKHLCPSVSFRKSRSFYIPDSENMRLLRWKANLRAQRSSRLGSWDRALSSGHHLSPQQEADGSMKLNSHQSKKQNQWVTLKPAPVKMQRKMLRSRTPSLLLPRGHTHLNVKSRETWNWEFYLETFPGGSVVKNLPTMQEPQEMWLRSLGWEDSLEEGLSTHFSILAWGIHGQRSLAGYSPESHKELDTTEVT